MRLFRPVGARDGTRTARTADAPAGGTAAPAGGGAPGRGGETPDSGGDTALMRAVAAGDAQALAELYDRNAGWLHARLARRCDDPETVREVLQDTFLTAWRSAGAFADGPVGGWLWTIAARRLVDARRAQARSARDRAEHVRQERAALAVPAPSAEARVLEGLEHGELGAALERLPSELRAVVRTTVVDGLTVREAARLLGVPEGTVKTRARRARRLLRAALSGGGGDGPAVGPGAGPGPGPVPDAGADAGAGLAAGAGRAAGAVTGFAPSPSPARPVPAGGTA